VLQIRTDAQQKLLFEVIIPHSSAVLHRNQWLPTINRTDCLHVNYIYYTKVFVYFLVKVTRYKVKK